MQFVPRALQLNRRWLTLGGAIALGILSTGLNHVSPQLEAQVRAAYRMISVLVAKKDLALAAQIQREVSAHDSHAKWSEQPYAFGHVSSRRRYQWAIGHYSLFPASRTIAPSNTHRPTTDPNRRLT